MITAAIIVGVIISLYLYSTRTFKHWEKKGVKHDKPIPLFGNNLRGFFVRRSRTQLVDEYYWKYPNEKVVGFYRFLQPELIIRDPEFINRVLITDFSSFYYRGILRNSSTAETLLKTLFHIDGDYWKLLRQRITPTFSTAKLKAMFPLIIERAERLQICTNDIAAQGKPVDARDLMARYTTDFIGACAFGLDSDSLNDENSPFRQLGKKIFPIPLSAIFLLLLKETFPRYTQNLTSFHHVERDMLELVGEILKKRDYKPCGRNDFIDLMLECRKEGIVVGDSISKYKSDGTPEEARLEFDDKLIAAQVFLFFAAGFETSSSATSFTLHQFAYHQDVQKKAQVDVDKVLAKYGGKLCYDAIKEMTYLGCSFKEGLRMFPSVGTLLRKSAKQYTFPEINLTIDEGTLITIPVQAMHNDPKYFDNPQEFRPERFDPKEFNSNNKYVYLPFGAGPRACIGERLGLMQSLAGLAAILSKFTVHPAPETKRYPEVEHNPGLIQTLRGGLPLMFCKRER